MKSMLLLLALIPQAQGKPSRTAGWKNDLALFAETIKKKHVRPFAQIKEDEFDQAIKSIQEQIGPSTDQQIVLKLQQLLGRVGDGHTRLFPSASIPFSAYPFRVLWFKDGFYVFATAESHKQVYKSKLVAIGKISIEDVYKSLATLFASENVSAERTNLTLALVNAHALHSLGIIDDMDRASFTFEKPDGNKETITLAPLLRPQDAKWSEPLKQLRLPVHQAVRRLQHGFIWLDESKTLFVWYDRCQDNPNLPISKWTTDVLREIDDKKPEKVVLDLRRNGGGNSILLLPLRLGIRGKKAINEKEKLFVLIGPGTYSSAMMNAQEFRRDTNALLVGQPTGGSPNSPGEVKTVTLPHSQCTLQYSTKLFQMTKDGANTISPDIAVEPTAEGFLSGRDEVLEAVLKRK